MSPSPKNTAGQHSTRAQQGPHGAYTQLDDLIRLRYDARKLRESSAVRPRSDNVGSRQSRQRARGIDFEEVRLYQQGDDVRTIDWRVTARTSTPHTKIFRAERDKPVFVFVDQRQHMFFGSRGCCKSVQAAYLAALLAWGAYHRGDQIGGCVLGNDGYRETRANRGYQTVLQFLHQINAYNNALKLQHNTAQGPHLADILSKLRRSMRPGTMVYVIADAYHLNVNDKHLTAHLHYMVRHCELRWLHVSDVMERCIPFQGRYLFTNGSKRAALYLNQASDQSYNKQYEKHMESISDYLCGLRIPLTNIDVTDIPIRILSGNLSASSATPQTETRAGS